MRNKTTLLLAMLIVFIIGILGFIGFFYHQTVRTNQINIKQFTENQLAYASRRMQNGQRFIEENASTILIDDTVKKIKSFPKTFDDYDYLQSLLEVKEMLRERLINGYEMESISIYWPQKDILISTETNLEMRKEIQKPIKNGKEWRETNKGFYFFMDYTFGNVEKNETTVAIEMSDALLMETQEAAAFNSSDTVVILPNKEVIGGSDKLHRELSAIFTDIKTVETNEIVPISSTGKNLVVNHVPDSGITIATVLPISNNDLVYTRNTLIILGAIVFIIIFGCSLIFLYYRNVVHEISLLTMKLQEVEQGDYDTRIEDAHNNEFSYLFDQFNQMVSSIQRLLRSLSNEMKQRELAEEKQFQSQIQPHFLYNSLFYIVSVADDSKAVLEMTRHLAEYYRYLTKKMDIVTLGEEVNFARHYLTIQSLRKDFKFKIELNKKDESLPILPLLIQPLIENAIAHGIEAKDGAKKIILDVSRREDLCCIEVIDDGPGMSEEAIADLEEKIFQTSRADVSDSVGLWNINQRLINYYGRTAKLRFKRSSFGGLSVSFEFSTKGGIGANETIDS